MADNRGNRRGSATGGGASSAGADAFLALSQRLKQAAPELRKELNKAMGKAAKPLIPKVRQAALSKFPQRGGLAQRVAKKPYRAQTRTGAATAGVRIVGTKLDPRLDQGRVQHPVFGRPGSTVVQNVPEAAGYFSETLTNEGPEIMQDIVDVLTDFTRRITARGL